MIKSLLLIVALATSFAASASDFVVKSPRFERVEVRAQDSLTFNNKFSYQATYDVVERIQQYTQKAVDIYEPTCESPYWHDPLRWPDFRETEENWARMVANQFYGMSKQQAAYIFKLSSLNDDSLLKKPDSWLEFVYRLALIEQANPRQLSGITYSVAVKNFDNNIEPFGFHATYASDCAQIMLEKEMLYVPTSVVEDFIGSQTFEIEIDVERTTLLPGERDFIKVINNDAKTELAMVGNRVSVIPAIEIKNAYYNNYDFDTDMEESGKIYVLAEGTRNKVAPTSNNLNIYAKVVNGYYQVHIEDLSYNANTSKGLGQRIVELDLSVWEPGQWFPGEIRVFNDQQVILEGRETVISTKKRAKGGFTEVISDGVQMIYKGSKYYNESWSARRKIVNDLR